jgi:hypothetical protein
MDALLLGNFILEKGEQTPLAEDDSWKARLTHAD